MRLALYVTLAPAWSIPASWLSVSHAVLGALALHDALVKPMPGEPLAPSLAESWTVSEDQRVYSSRCARA